MSDRDSDDEDIEVVIATPATQNVDVTKKPAVIAMTTNTSAKSIVIKADTAHSGAAPAKQGAVDLNAVGQYDGKDIFDVDLESFEDKPWRKPGADITDYFNFGFNEQTWRAYCMKQKQIREELNMQRKIGVYESIDPSPMDRNMMMPQRHEDQGMKYVRYPMQHDNRMPRKIHGAKRGRDHDDSVIDVTQDVQIENRNDMGGMNEPYMMHDPNASRPPMGYRHQQVELMFSSLFF
ncbi:Fip1 motif-domain-containing protein [Cladochytrium replicatum]|nr:Fip1 motif-domain-containing protein [Cladochytrium replicatum]